MSGSLLDMLLEFGGGVVTAEESFCSHCASKVLGLDEVTQRNEVPDKAAQDWPLSSRGGANKNE